MSAAAPKMPKIPRGCGWTVLVIGGLSLVIGLLSIAAIPRILDRSKEVWLESAGTLVEATVKRGERKKSSTKSYGGGRSRAIAVTYTVMLKYDYLVDGVSHRGESPCLDQPEDDEDYSQVGRILERYPAGKNLAVFHHPEEVERSRLTATEPRQEIVLDLVFTFLFTIIGVILLVLGGKILKRRGKSRT